MNIFESPYLRIQYEEAKKALIEEWQLDFTTTVAGANFREPLEQLLQEFQNRQAHTWLIDNSEQKTIDSKDQFWLETVYYPELVKRGLKKAVLVNTKNILGTVYARNCLKNLAGDDFHIEVFNNINDAQAWLQDQA